MGGHVCHAPLSLFLIGSRRVEQALFTVFLSIYGVRCSRWDLHPPQLPSVTKNLKLIISALLSAASSPFFSLPFGYRTELDVLMQLTMKSEIMSLSFHICKITITYHGTPYWRCKSLSKYHFIIIISEPGTEHTVCVLAMVASCLEWNVWALM